MMMRTIIKKDIIAFFSVPSGLLTLGLFYLLCLLFLWVFDTSFNLLNAGFADLNVYFNLAPWLLLFLIPALSMRSFSEEIKSGTLELLLTKPISLWQLVLGKFFAIVIVFALALLPTLVNCWALIAMMPPNTALDWGSIVGGYSGLLFLCCAFGSISSFASANAKNAVSAYLAGLTLCFIFYYGGSQFATGITDFWWANFIRGLGIQSHYFEISNGVLKLSDVVYFIGISTFFLALTHRVLQKIKAQ